MDALELHHCFPATAPRIGVQAIAQELDPIDCQELQWWFAVPRLGDRTACAWYDIDTGDLDMARQVVSTAAVTMNGQDAIELQLCEWSRDRDGDRVATHRFSCVLDQDRARCLAVTLDADDADESATLTEADPGFEQEWGGAGPRRLADSGRYQQRADGSYRLTEDTGSGAGVFRVRIGPRVFTCLRVIDLDGLSADESTELGVAYVEPGGRTVLYRQYRGRAMNDDWQEVASRTSWPRDRHR
jgi:hypothetical protein